MRAVLLLHRRHPVRQLRWLTDTDGCRSFYTPVDVQVIPTGEVKAVAGTPLDFREEHSFGERIAQMTDPPPGGYDTNFVLWSFDGPTAARQTQDCVVFDK